jgi:Na+-driven multidrug efflux pump
VFVEQFLLMLVGIADTVVVSFASEAAVSGVSLVNSFQYGPGVPVHCAVGRRCSHHQPVYRQRKTNGTAGVSASQLLMISVLISGAAFRADPAVSPIGCCRCCSADVEPEVMDACRVYLRILTCSLPALAVYDAGAALCRSIGKANVTMYISLAANADQYRQETASAYSF